MITETGGEYEAGNYYVMRGTEKKATCPEAGAGFTAAHKCAAKITNEDGISIANNGLPPYSNWALIGGAKNVACSGHGTCYATPTTDPVCTCTAGWEGGFCETRTADINWVCDANTGWLKDLASIANVCARDSEWWNVNCST